MLLRDPKETDPRSIAPATAAPERPAELLNVTLRQYGLELSCISCSTMSGRVPVLTLHEGEVTHPSFL